MATTALMVEPSSAIEILEGKLKDLEKQAEDIRTALATIRGAAKGEPHAPVHSHPRVRPGQFAGMKRTQALMAYLNERPGGVVFSKVLADLLEGGLERAKKSKDDRRLMRNTISQNPRLFSTDPDTDKISLKSNRSQ